MDLREAETNERRYVETGEGCPHCGKDGKVSGQEVTIEGPNAIQGQGCGSCGASWYASYGPAVIVWQSRP